ncbi:MAG: hypothetical protein JJU45_10890 [Acidimicrobiia bacterium]|nr:hypothetical protein [Acidimicrobiia bacterium]
MVDPTLARKAWRTLEPYHGFIYFDAGAAAAYEALGIPPHAGYFASRAAPLGAVPAEVVIATFYNFRPEMVRDAIPAAWAAASPERIVAARLAAADATLRRILGDEVTSDAMGDAASLARRATTGCASAGRPLFAAHAALPWPDEPHLVLWHAITLLREFRGDGHLAALVVAGLDGPEALVTHEAAGEAALPPGLLQATRGWSDDEWSAARDRLRAKGLLTDEGRLTPDGADLRAEVEEHTDRVALAPWETLGAEGTERLRGLVRPWSKAIVASGVFGLGT